MFIYTYEKKYNINKSSISPFIALAHRSGKIEWQKLNSLFLLRLLSTLSSFQFASLTHKTLLLLCQGRISAVPALGIMKLQASCSQQPFKCWPGSINCLNTRLMQLLEAAVVYSRVVQKCIYYVVLCMSMYSSHNSVPPPRVHTHNRVM